MSLTVLLRQRGARCLAVVTWNCWTARRSPQLNVDRRPAHLVIAWSEDPDIDDVVLDGIGRCCRAGVDAELVEDVADVAMHRSFAHEQLDRDRVVRPASGEQPQHLELACAQAAGAESRTVQQLVDPAEIGAGAKAGEG
jgi:hypothetical protein